MADRAGIDGRGLFSVGAPEPSEQARLPQTLPIRTSTARPERPEFAGLQHLTTMPPAGPAVVGQRTFDAHAPEAVVRHERATMDQRAGSAASSEDQIATVLDLYKLSGRKIHGRQIAACLEWIEKWHHLTPYQFLSGLVNSGVDAYHHLYIRQYSAAHPHTSSLHQGFNHLVRAMKDRRDLGDIALPIGHALPATNAVHAERAGHREAVPAAPPLPPHLQQAMDDCLDALNAEMARESFNSAGQRAGFVGEHGWLADRSVAASLDNERPSIEGAAMPTAPVPPLPPHLQRAMDDCLNSLNEEMERESRNNPGG